MNLPIFWSPEIKESYLNIIDFLEKNWNLKEVNSFLDRVDEILHLLSLSPKIYIYYNKLIAYRCVSGNACKRLNWILEI